MWIGGNYYMANNMSLSEVMNACKEQIKILRKYDPKKANEMQNKYDDIRDSALGQTKTFKLTSLYHTLKGINKDYE